MASKNATRVVLTVQVGGPVPKDLADDFKALADEHDRAVLAELRMAMRHWLAMHKSKRGAA